MTKKEQIKEVLAVLDMPEKKQCRWICDYFNEQWKEDLWWREYGARRGILLHNAYPGRKTILADLAFKMRDKIKRDESAIKFYSAFRKVAKKVQGRFLNNDDRLLLFIIYNAQPIHWIVASIIAGILAESGVKDVNSC